MIEHTTKKKRKSDSVLTKGQSLIEILIAVTLIAVIAAIVVMFAQTGLRSTKVSQEKTRTNEIAQEILEITKALALRDWINVCENASFAKCKTVAGLNYFPTLSQGLWELTTGTEAITLDGISYTRWVMFEKVCRDNAGVAVASATGTCSAGTEDPSSRKVVVTVESRGTGRTLFINFVTRWGGQRADLTRGTNIFYQTDWQQGPLPGQVKSAEGAGTTNLGTNFETSTQGIDYLDSGVIWLDAQ